MCGATLSGSIKLIEICYIILVENNRNKYYSFLNITFLVHLRLMQNIQFLKTRRKLFVFAFFMLQERIMIGKSFSFASRSCWMKVATYILSSGRDSLIITEINI